MSRRPLYEYIGDPITVIAPLTITTAAHVASDNAAGVPILGADGILFIETLGATDSTSVQQIQIQYSSTGNASDAATSNAGMTCTDAVFTVMPAASSGFTQLLHVDVKAKGMSDAAGKFYATIAAAEGGAVIGGLIGIPYGGTRLYPATNAATVINDATAV
jgi:hypothetical protein